MNRSRWTAKVVVGVIGGIAVAAVADVVDKLARGHWASVGHLIIVAVVSAVVVALLPLPQLQR